jgi:hypothetical protein
MHAYTLVLVLISMVFGVLMFMASLYTYTWTISRRTQTTENMVLTMTMLATRYMEFDLQKSQQPDMEAPNYIE